MSTTQPETTLGRAEIAAADSTDQLGDVLSVPEHLRDAMWKAESAGVSAWDSPGGLIVAGMGGSAIGGRLARAILGELPFFVRHHALNHDQPLFELVTPDGIGRGALLVAPDRRHATEVLCLGGVDERFDGGSGRWGAGGPVEWISGVALATNILDGYADANVAERIAFLEALANNCGPDLGRL